MDGLGAPAVTFDGQRLLGYSAPLFIHQYSQLYVDFRGFDDGFGNYFDNGALATRRIGKSVPRTPVCRLFAPAFGG